MKQAVHPHRGCPVSDSPASNGGRGLKLLGRLEWMQRRLDSPASNGGRGLKPVFVEVFICKPLDSPASNGGRGLKHAKSYNKHPGFTYIRTDEGPRIASIEENPHGAAAARGVLGAIGQWLMSLTPQTQAYRAKERPSLINSKRRAKGKPPALFDWHTVVIAPPPEPGPPKGGTHASPRLHDRRGHWRKHPSGKQVWVKACKVGDAAKGVIFKDYKIGGTAP